MKVLHFTPTISREGGGPSRSVQGLVAALGSAGVDVVLASATPGELPWLPGISQFVRAEDFASFAELLERVQPDLVHLHGVWAPCLHQVAKACRKLGVPYVIAPRGMLEPWALRQKRLKKCIARWLYQDADLHGAIALHATAQSEADQFRRLGFSQQIIISPNGVNVPDQRIEKSREGVFHRVLFVSRMHPKKGVLELIEAWGRVKKLPKGSDVPWKCELVYTVLDETERNYEGAVKARVAELGLSDDFIFTGALNDDEKWRAYARADLFVLPTYSENFGIVVAEALWAEVPVITTQGTPWCELRGGSGGLAQCGWWIEIGVEPLVAALREAMSLDEVSRRAFGAAGHALVLEQYTWPSLAQKLARVYQELLAR